MLAALAFINRMAQPKSIRGVINVLRSGEIFSSYTRLLVQAGWDVRIVTSDQLPVPLSGRATLINVQYRGEFHDALRDSLVEDFRRYGASLVRKVPFHMVGATTEARCDFVGRPRDGPSAIVVEVKTGTSPRFSMNQRTV